MFAGARVTLQKKSESIETVDGRQVKLLPHFHADLVAQARACKREDSVIARLCPGFRPQRSGSTFWRLRFVNPAQR